MMRPLALARRATLLFLLAAIIFGLVAAIFRVVVPEFINAHNDLLVLLGVLAAVGGVITVGWLVLAFWLFATRPLSEPKDQP